MSEYVIAYISFNGGQCRLKTVEAENPGEAASKFRETGKGVVKDVYAPVPRDVGGFAEPANVTEDEMRFWVEHLTKERDEAAVNAAACSDPVLQSSYRDDVRHARSELSGMHIFTHGKYGQSREEQLREAGEQS